MIFIDITFVISILSHIFFAFLVRIPESSFTTYCLISGKRTRIDLPNNAVAGDIPVVLCGVARYVLNNLHSIWFNGCLSVEAIFITFSSVLIKRSHSALALG